MPELPEVETTVRGLARVLEGRTITRIETRRAGLRRPFPVDLAQALTGARVTGLSRRAKYGLIHTDRDRTMVFHLGMSGRWRIDPGEIGKHDHLVLETSSQPDQGVIGQIKGQTLALNDARRFGSVDLVDTARLDQWPAFAALGPEPLGEGLTVGHLASAFDGRIAAVKLLLLDQRIVAGLGNIYVCEALNRAKIHPERAGGKVGKAALARLVPEIRAVLGEAIAAGGSTLCDFVRPDGELGYFAKDWRVYGREGEACRCGGTVIRVAQGGRSSFFCAKCQK